MTFLFGICAVAGSWIFAEFMQWMTQGEKLVAEHETARDPWTSSDMRPDTGFPHYDEPKEYARKVARWRKLHYPEGESK